ncbi:MAG: adenylyl-sulfate kinase [Candidatus Thioglobus sp.]|nr:MAG: adenylyl-sulfate kinase [Candidatus Thioglobus sp.]
MTYDITLTHRQLCDLELILNGGFYPLDGFLTQQDYESVLSEMRLKCGAIWTIPICLDVDKNTAKSLKIGDLVTLRSAEYLPIAELEVASIWRADKLKEAQAIFNTSDDFHPGVAHLLTQTAEYYIGGKTKEINSVPHYNFEKYRYTAQELKAQFKAKGWQAVVAFHTQKPMHKAQFELTKLAAKQANAKLLIHPVVGCGSSADADYSTNVHCYEKILPYYPNGFAMLALLNLSMRMAGGRETVLYALIRKNFGCTHFIIDNDYADICDKNGVPYYNANAVKQLLKSLQGDLGIEILDFDEICLTKISDAEFSQKLEQNLPIPAGFSFPEVVAELQKLHPPKHQQGVVILLTGLSGSGKSSIANALSIKLSETDKRHISLLDGDIIRQMLSPELTFSKEDRELHSQRIGFVASKISSAKGIVICALIAPYAKARESFKRKVEDENTNFFEVYLSTPLKTCEARDRKGLYALARQGKIANFTGINHPYEIPKEANIAIDTSNISIEQSIAKIMASLAKNNYIETSVIADD